MRRQRYRQQAHPDNGILPVSQSADFSLSRFVTDCCTTFLHKSAADTGILTTASIDELSGLPVAGAMQIPQSQLHLLCILCTLNVDIFKRKKLEIPCFPMVFPQRLKRSRYIQLVHITNIWRNKLEQKCKRVTLSRHIAVLYDSAKNLDSIFVNISNVACVLGTQEMEGRLTTLF